MTKKATFPYKPAQGQKPMLRQTEWGVQNGLTPKKRLMPLDTLLFGKFNFSVKASLKKVDLKDPAGNKVNALLLVNQSLENDSSLT